MLDAWDSFAKRYKGIISNNSYTTWLYSQPERRIEKEVIVPTETTEIAIKHLYVRRDYNDTSRTVFQARIECNIKFSLLIRERDILDRFLEKFGAHYLKSSNPLFNKIFIVKSNDKKRGEAFLSNEKLLLSLNKTQYSILRIKSADGIKITLNTEEELIDLGKIELYFDLFKAILAQLYKVI